MSNLGNQASQCSLDKVADALPDELKKKHYSIDICYGSRFKK